MTPTPRNQRLEVCPVLAQLTFQINHFANCLLDCLAETTTNNVRGKMRKLFIISVSLLMFFTPATIANAAELPIYMKSSNAAAVLSVIATSGDTISGKYLPGIPDGMGALKNANGTITLLSNHEISNADKNAQLGRKENAPWGASISRMTYDVSTSKVTEVTPFIKSISYYNYTTGKWSAKWQGSAPAGAPASDSYGAENFSNALNRFCSGDLIPAGGMSHTEIVNKKKITYGTTESIYLTGEEGSDWSRVFAFDMNGNGVQLPRMGLASWENALANPASGKSTVVMLNEDGSATDSQLYMYLGTKQTNGANFAEKAGFTNGELYTLSVANFRTDNAFRTAVKPGVKIDADFNKVNWNPRFVDFAKQSQSSGTTFARVEDGVWDPKNPNVYYFLTTESNKDPLATAPNPSTPTVKRDGGALWKLTFKDVKKPLLGAELEILLNGSEGIYLNKPDNLGIDPAGYLLIQEDPGGNEHIARIVAYRIFDGKTAVVATFDENFVKTGGSRFITIDEETSGIVDVSALLRSKGDLASYFFLNAQIHAPASKSRPDLTVDAATLDAAVLEGGQYYLLKINDWNAIFN